MQTLETLFRQYLAEVALEQEPSTQYQQRMFFAKVLRELGPLPLDAVTPEVLRAWKAQLSVGHTRATVARYMAYLACALRYAVLWGWVAQHPMQQIRKPSPGPRRVRFLTVDERQRLLAACRQSRNPCLYPLVVLALTTGGRKNELRWLRWNEVDCAQGVVRFLKTKTHQARAVPLVGEGAAVVQRLALQRRDTVPWLFPRDDGSQPRDIECAWTTARRRAAVVDFRFHDLRHTFASYMAMSGASLRDIAEVLGHRRIQQTMIYSHLLPSHTRAVVERMTQQFLAGG